ncbi:MAG: HAMP domain-containing protein [Leptospirales bacterium]
MGPSNPLSVKQESSSALPPIIGKLPWRKRLTTRLFLWFFVLLSLGFTGVGFQIFHLVSVRDRNQVQSSLQQRTDLFIHSFSLLMEHQDMVGARDLLESPGSQKNREGILLLKPDGQTLAFSDISTIEEMRKRSILLPTLGLARRLQPLKSRMALLKTPESIKAYQSLEMASEGSSPHPFIESRPASVAPAFVLFKAIPNQTSCQTCHNSEIPVLGYVAAYQDSGPYHRSLHQFGMNLFWALLGTLEVLVLLLIWLIRGKLVTPLVNVSGTMGKMAVQDPDFRTRLTLKREDEIGQLTFFVNRFIDLFQGWIGEISDRIRWVHSQSERLSESNQAQKREEIEYRQELSQILLRIRALQSEIGREGEGPAPRESLLDLLEKASIYRMGMQEFLNAVSAGNPDFSRKDLRQLSGLLDPLGQILAEMEQKIGMGSESLGTIERKIRGLEEKERTRNANRPVMDMRLREILKVASELEKELSRFKS